MKDTINELKNKFIEIKNMGYVKAVNSNSSGIGITFEQLLKINSGNFEIPDFEGIEIKTRRKYSESGIILFTAVPDGPNLFETKRLKDTYGYPDRICREFPVLLGVVYGNKLTKIGIKYAYKLNVDRKNEKIFLQIYNLNGKIIEDNVYWSFDLLREKLERKLKVLALVSAWPSKIKDNTYYRYYKMDIYTLKSFDGFIELIERGVIRLSFRIGIFRSGERFGQMHDHGSGFEIKECDLLKLYDLYKQ